MNPDAFIGVWMLRRKHLRACVNRWMRILVCSALSVRSRKALYKNKTAPLPPSLFIFPHPRHANVSQSSWPVNVQFVSVRASSYFPFFQSRHCIASFLETWDCLVVKIPNQIIYHLGNFFLPQWLVSVSLSAKTKIKCILLLISFHRSKPKNSLTRQSENQFLL